MRLKIDPDNWVALRGYRKNRLADETLLACPGRLVQMVVMETNLFRVLELSKSFARNLMISESSCDKQWFACHFLWLFQK